MIKALSICFAALLVQLVALHWVDKRNNTPANEARRTTSSTPPTRQDDQAHRPSSPARDTADTS